MAKLLFKLFFFYNNMYISIRVRSCQVKVRGFRRSSQIGAANDLNFYMRVCTERPFKLIPYFVV